MKTVAFVALGALGVFLAVLVLGSVIEWAAICTATPLCQAILN